MFGRHLISVCRATLVDHSASCSGAPLLSPRCSASGHGESIMSRAATVYGRFSGRGFRSQSYGRVRSNPNSSQSNSASHGSSAQATSWRSLMKATTFTVTGCCVSMVGCVVWEYENIRHLMSRQRSPLSWIQSPFRTVHKEGEWRRVLNQWWHNQTEGQRVFWPILALNAAVFVAWRVPACNAFMMKFFVSDASTKAKLSSFLLCAFSHMSAVHLACNMFVLHSFSTGAVEILGREQFIGLYVSGALVSSLTSYVTRAMSGQVFVSLGASGALMAVLAFVCAQCPDQPLSVIFLPMFSFPASTALKTLMMFDTLGVLLRWQLFDHAAHLGGAVFGLWWALWGRSELWEKRAPVIRCYHDLREAVTSDDKK